MVIGLGKTLDKECCNLEIMSHKQGLKPYAKQN